MLALIYLGLAVCVGERLCGYFYRFVSTPHRWATGALVGVLLSTGFTYLVARLCAGANNPLILGDLAFFAAATIFLVNCRPKRDPSAVPLRTSGSETWDWIALALFGVLVSWMMFATLNFKDKRLEIGVTQWSDYGPNTAIVQSFAYGHNFPTAYPHFAGEPIRYHFLFYFQAGNLEFLGLNLAWSVNILSILTLVSMLGVVMALGERLFRSRVVGWMAAALFFFHGTLNLVPFLQAQKSVKEALLAIYHVPAYLSSHYPYRGEDWGIWTQVVFINQRHLASSIGIFLIVLFFLFDRYLERVEQKKRARALAAGPSPSEPIVAPAVAEGLATFGGGEQTGHISGDEAQTSGGFQSTEGWLPDAPTRSEGEAESSRMVESPPEPHPAANYATSGEVRTLDTVAQGEQMSPEPETSISEAVASGTLKPLEESSHAANDLVAETLPSPETLTHDEPSRLEPETSLAVEAESSSVVEAHEESPQPTSQASTALAPTFATLAYDEYIGRHSATTLASEAKESEALESAKESSREAAALPVPESVSETDALSTPLPEATAVASRGMIAEFVHDNLVNGKGFLFSGLLLGALPYWNSPVFTAAAAVLALLFFFFPYRRYMVGLAFAAAVVGLPQVLALRSGNVRAGVALIHWGYTLGNVPVVQVLKYLWWTFGLKLPLILIALLFCSWVHWRLFISLFVLFLLTFCCQFSDEVLANHKFLNIWLVIANLYVAYGLWRLWRLKILWKIPSRLLALALAAPIVAGGVIDFFPIHNATFIETNYADDRLIAWLRKETKPDAVFVSDKFVNHPILLSGRRIFFGYTYFTWSAGYDLTKREADYKLMFESKNAHQVFTLLKAYNIDYVAIDAGVRGVFKNLNEEQVYAPNFQKVFDGPEYWQLAIYKVPENASFVPKSASAGTVNAAVPVISAFEGGKGTENGQFDLPRGLVIDNSGNILVADTNNGRLQKFSPTGVFMSVIGKPGSGPGEFREPCGIGVDSGGNIYVADVSNHRVQKLKPDGTFIAEWRGPDPGFYGPRDLAIGPDDSVYVVDQGHSRIVKFDPNGSVMATWGGPGTENGQFGDATSVAVDGKNDRTYVADVRNNRIVIFDTNGKFITNWPVDEWHFPSGWHFQDIAIDSEAGRLYTSSTSTDEILVFDLTGKKIASLKPAAPDKLVGASALALVKGKLYVANTFGNYLSRIDLDTK